MGGWRLALLASFIVMVSAGLGLVLLSLYASTSVTSGVAVPAPNGASGVVVVNQTYYAYGVVSAGVLPVSVEYRPVSLNTSGYGCCMSSACGVRVVEVRGIINVTRRDPGVDVVVLNVSILNVEELRGYLDTFVLYLRVGGDARALLTLDNSSARLVLDARDWVNNTVVVDGLVYYECRGGVCCPESIPVFLEVSVVRP